MPTRLNDFRRFWVQQLAIHDCDPGIYALKYLVKRQELNTEQQVWLCWLYASTYNVATAWVIFNEFPDYENVDVERLAAFNRANIKRLPYQKDQKWLRGCLAPMLESYRAMLGNLNQGYFFTNHCRGFAEAWKAVMGLYKVGRYTAWMFLQAVNEVCGMGWKPSSLELDHESSRMHRTGLCLALGMDSWAVKGRKFDGCELAWLDAQAANILCDVRSSFPQLTVVHPDYFSMETALCAFSKLFRTSRGRYLGYYLDRWAEDIQKTASMQWDGINWDLLWECRAEGIPKEFDRRTGIDKSQFSLYLDCGEFMTETPTFHKLHTWYYDHPSSAL